MSLEPAKCPYCKTTNDIETEYYEDSLDPRDMCSNCGGVFGFEIIHEIKIKPYKYPH
jgi:Zn ribbon nucleic-acid-binding protein